MTLIAALQCEGLAVVVGDLLLSGTGDGPESVSVPSVGDVSDLFAATDDWRIVGLSQKLAVLSPDVVVAWSGAAVAARTVVAEFQALVSKTKEFTAEAASSFLESIPETVGTLPLSMIGFVSERERLTAFGHNALAVDVPNLGKGFVAGSGAEAAAAGLALSQPSRLYGSASDTEAGFSHALTLTGVLLMAETQTQNSLRRFFGGGYQLAAHLRDGFAKVSNITYVFSSAQILNNNRVVLREPSLVLKLSYDRDYLMLQAIRIVQGQLIKDLYYIPEILSQRTDAAPPRESWPSIESRFVCSYVLVESAGRKHDILCLISSQTERRTLGERLRREIFPDFVDMFRSRFGKRWSVILPTGRLFDA